MYHLAIIIVFWGKQTNIKILFNKKVIVIMATWTINEPRDTHSGLKGYNNRFCLWKGSEDE